MERKLESVCSADHNAVLEQLTNAKEAIEAVIKSQEALQQSYRDLKEIEIEELKQKLAEALNKQNIK